MRDCFQTWCCEENNCNENQTLESRGFDSENTTCYYSCSCKPDFYTVQYADDAEPGMPNNFTCAGKSILMKYSIVWLVKNNLTFDLTAQCPDFACGANQVSIGNIQYDETRQCVTDICDCVDGFFNLQGQCVGKKIYVNNWKEFSYSYK